MPSDEPNATWHPAFMPASAAEAPAKPALAPQALEESNASHTADEVVADGVAEAEAEACTADHDETAADAWFPEYDASNPWTGQLRHADADMSNTPVDHDQATGATAEPSAEPVVSDKANKHMSTVSFTRTVSNEVNWDADDDDNTEWSLSRADTDPFKFMSPTDRTNSFPVVPALDTMPADEQSDRSLDHQPLTSNEASDIIQEVDQEVSQYAELEPSHADALLDHSYAVDHAAAASDDALGIRFEEGVPLISHDHHQAAEPSPPEHKADDPFGEEAIDEDDDFFNHAGPSDREPAEMSPKPAFERKSTIQVLQAMNVGALGHNSSDLAAAMEEEEESDIAAQVPKASSKDLAAEWAAALASDDEDELLMDDSVLETDNKELDPAAFFEDDDEGFLDDEVPEVPQVNGSQPQPTANRYVPAGPQMVQPLQTPQPANPYLPTTTFSPAQPVVPSPFVTPGPPPSQFPLYGSTPSQERPAPKAQSFADKSKGGYHSPYDLPMDVVKPRKRPSMQHLPRTVEAASAPPPGPPILARSTSMQTLTLPSVLQPNYEQSPAAPLPKAQATPLSAPVIAPVHESFFEELPMVSKARPASRHTHGSPVPASPYGPPQAAPIHPPPQTTPPAFSQPPHTPSFAPPQAHYSPAPTPAPPQEQPAEQTSGTPDIVRLVAPPRTNPYASTVSSNLAPQSAASPQLSRYSPSPNMTLHANGSAHVSPPSRYSPAPVARTPSTGYAPIPAGVPPPILAHQPRTSSPLAHFEMSYDKPRNASLGHPIIRGESNLPERRSSSSAYDPRLNRVPSLPPTREVEEDESQARPPTSSMPNPAPPPTNQYSPQKSRQTPPPQASSYGLSTQTLSPPKRILNYTPHSDPIPQRALTQSPASMLATPPAPKPADSAPASIPLPLRPRAASQNLNLVPPTDGTEQDPLQRWKGAPIFAWGVGGVFVSSFPRDIPRYGINQALPMYHREAGDVQIKHIKEIHPLEERLARFPGPLKGKSKKKEVIAWLTAGIEDLARSLPSQSFSLQVSHEDKRLEERILLWKILRVFVEHDGVLEGAPAVDKAVRDCLLPFVDETVTAAEVPAYTAGIGIAGLSDGPSSGQMQSDAVDPAVVEQIRKNLLLGDKEKAAWDAVDKRLWGHAFLIARAASAELFKKVAQEFVRKEVNTPGHNNESLAALYDVLSGNHEECVDELVPIHARAGLQLISRQPAAGEQSKDALAGLDNWRETLCLVLNNRTTDDVQAINSLGNLLSGYGRAEAAHVCFLFSRNVTVFGGLDDAAANFVLLGADHKRQVDSFAKETDAVLLSEVYEYGLSLGGSAAATGGSPHLAAYKLQHAMTLAEYGFRDRALQYCEAIMGAITAQSRRSPYHHVLLETAVDDLMKRLKQAPKEESNSWIPKPSMNKVSDTMWNRFNKFVAGDEAEGGGVHPDGEGAAESGPFARLPGGTPTISRPQSSAGLTGMDMFSPQSSQFSPTFVSQTNGGVGGSGMVSPPPMRSASRYAPGAGAGGQSVTSPISVTSPYEPNTTGFMSLSVSAPAAGVPNLYEPPSAFAASGRRSLEYQPAEVSSRRASSELSPGYLSGYNATGGQSDSGRNGLSRQSSYTPLVQVEPVLTPTSEAPRSEQRPEPSPVAEFGFQPMSYGYEPPSFRTSFGAGASEEVETRQPAQPVQEETTNGGYASPSFQPYSYEPPSFDAGAEPDAETSNGNGELQRKKSFMDDDNDGIATKKKPTEKTKEEKDRENAEMFRKAAEEDAKRAEAAKAKKKGWGLPAWLGGGKKEVVEQAPKAVRANLGEKSSFYYDADLKRWINKNGARLLRPLGASPSVPNLRAVRGSGSVPPPLIRSISGVSLPGSASPSRPGTGVSEANSIDDLLGAAGPRKPRKGRKTGRYVDVMAQ
ncbi:copii vesicle coat protein [Grosmannia clavigera kw1407]|uniref:Protein transport protein sec16 n=1 Tax=Grosmannia clavigera (strain kw1407 / UAMH 11150) TaxID=655863 RepID=F0XCZ3_GROCL|nr:copii vesicle coat protein [Grosmannia clavigera kw1407]EFX03970.1 copii vesicle coat protein [Grosmannia clavigera kw1407]